MEHVAIVTHDAGGAEVQLDDAGEELQGQHVVVLVRRLRAFCACSDAVCVRAPCNDRRAC